MVDPVIRNDSRTLDEQREAVLEMITSHCELAATDLKRLDRSLIYFQQCMCAYSGWGDEHLLKAAKSLVETINEMHADANDDLISSNTSESLSCLIHNNLLVGEYGGGDTDPTTEWRNWQLRNGSTN